MVLFDIVEAILFRCLVSDLLRCKSVCKSWYSLISSPIFVKTHCKFICDKEDINKRKIDVFKSYQDLYPTPPEWEYYIRWNVTGSSNGLVCIESINDCKICVTNPLTREFRELAELPKLTKGKPYLCVSFGYDSSTDDYKLVVALNKSFDGSLVHILSLKSNTWKVFGHVNYRFDNVYLATSGILFNGALHWFWLNPNDATGENIVLVSFDLAKEEFKEIPQPNDSRYVWNFGYSLGIMDGRLCIYPCFDDVDEFPTCGTWVIKNYNVKPSWDLLPNDRGVKDHAIHHILNNTRQSKIMPAYFCDENIELSRNKEYFPSPIFVQTLVSPYLNSGGPSHAKNNKSAAANAGSVEEKREIEDFYSKEEKEMVIGLLELEGGLK